MTLALKKHLIFFYDSMKNYHQPLSTQCSKYVDLVNWCYVMVGIKLHLRRSLSGI